MAEHDPHVTAQANAPARQHAVVIGNRHLTIEDIVAIARDQQPVLLSADAAWRDRIERGAQFLGQRLAEGATIYGVNTGYGDACQVSVPMALVGALPLQLTRYHGCGMGRHLEPTETLAVVAARLNSLPTAIRACAICCCSAWPT